MRPYVIYAPPYQHRSYGIRVLHNLCHRLNLLGVPAFLVLYRHPDQPLPVGAVPHGEGVYPGWCTPLLEQEALLEEAVVIYPETVSGNPLRAKRVVRYLLNRPYYISRSPICYEPGDYLISYLKDIDDTLPRLFILIDETDTFHPPSAGSIRRGGVYYVGKGRSFSSDLLDPSLSWREITSSWPPTRQEVADLLRSSEVFYSADNLTALSYEAARCGTPVLMLGDAYTADFRGRSELSPLGMAFRPEELPFARATASLAFDEYRYLLAQQDVQILDFVETTQVNTCWERYTAERLAERQALDLARYQLKLQGDLFPGGRKALDQLALRASFPWLPLSIVVLLRDDARQVLACLNLLKALTRVDYEVFLVDSGHSSQVSDVARDVSLEEPRFNWVRVADDLSDAEALNVGLSWASKEFVAVLESTTLLGVEWAERLLYPLTSDFSLGASAPSQSLECPDATQETLSRFAVQTQQWAGSPWGSGRRTNRPPGGCMVVRRLLLERLGGFAQSTATFAAALEDWSQRLCANGFDLWSAEDVQSGTLGGKPPEVMTGPGALPLFSARPSELLPQSCFPHYPNSCWVLQPGLAPAWQSSSAQRPYLYVHDALQREDTWRVARDFSLNLPDETLLIACLPGQDCAAALQPRLAAVSPGGRLVAFDALDGPLGLGRTLASADVLIGQEQGGLADAARACGLKVVPSAAPSTWAMAEEPFQAGIKPYELDGVKGTVILYQPRWAEQTWAQVLMSYRHAFTAESDVSLVIWLDPSQGFSLDWVASQVQSLFGEVNGPDVLLVPDALDLFELAGLYAAATVVLAPSSECERKRAAQMGKLVLEFIDIDKLKDIVRSRQGAS